MLVLASYFFYGWWDWRFCGLIDLETPFLMAAFAANGPVGPACLPLLAGFVAIEWCQRGKAHPLDFASLPWPFRWATYVAGSTAIVLWGTFGSTPFIYFQF